MLPREARLIIEHGAPLDAWAAAVSSQLALALPAYRDQLVDNQKDELAHAGILSTLTKEAPREATYANIVAYANVIGKEAFTANTDGKLALLNFVERRSVVQFKLAWRVTRNMNLLAIAHDEERHVKLGREILRERQVSKIVLEAAHFFISTADKFLSASDLPDLKTLNDRVLDEMIEACSS